MALQQSFWMAGDGSLFNTEADADGHDAKVALMQDLTKLDQFWTGKSPFDVVSWLLDNYELTKKLTADAKALPADPSTATVTGAQVTP